MRSLSTHHPACLPGLVLAIDERVVSGLRVLHADTFLAVDRPDRLEVSCLRPPSSTPDPDERWRPGCRIRAQLGDEGLFEGRIERVDAGVDAARGPYVSVVAYADYQGLRFPRAPVTLYQVTDAEMAEHVASSLDLVAVTEPTPHVHAKLPLCGDPLLQLRKQARSCGVELAVTGRRLYFTRHVPESGEIVMDDPRKLLALRVTDRGEAAGGRGGSLEARGDPCWRPLKGLILAGPDPIVNGHYRVVRALHRLDGRGYRTTVEFLERGLDHDAWSGRRPQAERGESDASGEG